MYIHTLFFVGISSSLLRLCFFAEAELTDFFHFGLVARHQKTKQKKPSATLPSSFFGFLCFGFSAKPLHRCTPSPRIGSLVAQARQSRKRVGRASASVAQARRSRKRTEEEPKQRR
uniref:Secreted protein n=1 Tax=Pediastrum duplex TaxID=3105 RepID=A0A2U8GIT0_PEDDU|nr:hypothetical protein [Pediastrum duplex]